MVWFSMRWCFRKPKCQFRTICRKSPFLPVNSTAAAAAAVCADSRVFCVRFTLTASEQLVRSLCFYFGTTNLPPGCRCRRLVLGKHHDATALWGRPARAGLQLKQRDHYCPSTPRITNCNRMDPMESNRQSACRRMSQLSPLGQSVKWPLFFDIGLSRNTTLLPRPNLTFGL